MTLNTAQLDGLLNKLESGNGLSPAEVQQVKELVQAMGLTIRVQSDQLRFFENQIAILKDGNAAVLAAGEAAVAAVTAIAPPGTTIDSAAVTGHIDTLRKDIKNSTSVAQGIASAAKFALNLAGKFV